VNYPYPKTKVMGDVVGYGGICSIKPPITDVQFRRGKAHAAFGLHFETGKMAILREISVTWELGLRGG
jgi:hypothetical protein